MKRRIEIEGMSCMHCVAHVKEALEEMAQISAVEVSLEQKCAIIEGDALEDQIKEAIDEAGYEVVKIEEI